MFSSAFKSFSSNITSNYEVSKTPTATSGAWTIFDAKKKSTGAQASIFVFEKKLLEVSSNGFGARASATSIRKVQDEVVDRLKKEASSLARLRHPSILQLVEPVEDTRSGGLMFATEPVVASLSGALAQKDRNERSSNGRRDNRDYASSPASRTSKDVEVDELEIQKGLLQVAKGLEFLHDSAKLVHGNLTPDAIFINAKSDWKISGLSFSGPPSNAEGHQSVPQISLGEVLRNDPRLPPTVQLNLDYTSPDFVMDNNINFSADIFSLGLVILACYRSPHISPVETHGSQSTYKTIFASSSTAPTRNNNYLCSNKLPNELEQVLPRILARKPAQRMNATEFQQSEYFDNILVNTMRFLDGLPAKTPAEKAQFMRGLAKVMPQFPASVLSKKVLSALLDELKDRELLSLLLQNIFQILRTIPDPKEALSDRVLPRLREIFLAKSKIEERDTSKEAGLMVFLENIQLIADNSTAKQFKDDALPIVHIAMESPTHSLVDAALSTLSTILPVLDFSTVKHDLFPVIGNVFSKTNSLAIKVRGLEALGVLCGASDEKPSRGGHDDDFSGMTKATNDQDKPTKSTSSLDKFTMQEKIVPLIKGIKTKEPAVMMASLKVFQQIAKVGDVDFLAIEVMPILWTFALGPLLDLGQFKAYMETIRMMSGKIEREQIRKLQELSSSSTRPESTRTINSQNSSSRTTNGMGAALDTNNAEVDFKSLVSSGRGANSSHVDDSKDPFSGALSDAQTLRPNPPSFSWQSSTITTSSRPTTSINMSILQPNQPISRSITPDVQMQMPAFQPLQPSSTSSQQRLQATNYTSNSSFSTTSPTPTPTPTSGNINIWSQPHHQTMSPSIVSPPSTSTPMSTFTPMLAPPPSSPPIISSQQQHHRQTQPNYFTSSNYNPNPSPNPSANWNASTILQPQSQTQARSFQNQTPVPLPTLHQQQQQQQQQQKQKTGLDKYESLL